MQDNTKCQCSPSPESPSNNTKCQDGVASKQASKQARLPSVQARRLYRCACCAAILRPQAAVYSYGTTAAHTCVLLYRLRVNEKVRGIALVGLSVKGRRAGIPHTDWKRKTVRGFPLSQISTHNFLRALDNADQFQFQFVYSQAIRINAHLKQQLGCADIGTLVSTFHRTSVCKRAFNTFCVVQHAA